MTEFRDCKKCVHHTSGSCSAWTCHGMETIKDVKSEAVRSFTDWIIDKKSSCGYIEDVPVGVLQEWALEWENEVNK